MPPGSNERFPLLLFFFRPIHPSLSLSPPPPHRRRPVLRVKCLSVRKALFASPCFCNCEMHAAGRPGSRTSDGMLGWMFLDAISAVDYWLAAARSQSANQQVPTKGQFRQWKGEGHERREWWWWVLDLLWGCLAILHTHAHHQLHNNDIMVWMWVFIAPHCCKQQLRRRASHTSSCFVTSDRHEMPHIESRIELNEGRQGEEAQMNEGKMRYR